MPAARQCDAPGGDKVLILLAQQQFVDIDFVDYDLAVIFFCQFFQDRGYASAWAAPCGGEVYDCRLGAEVVHFFAVKVVYQF